ncbi:putative 30S ribosomal protein S10, mitochondrial [Glarea lozoyensis 74030]|uniref:Putative 30S ribosomal protein S10, mitochondrial n=1 Tax=Glarea lozoyensis (strain ATCC 74030 / MF5533) TaxID=1104152 RepID=H0EIF6_GLAL7|nr:putative 30S ribosomal protein S10, mitochondrial [Glarea lozoyensis 74030]
MATSAPIRMPWRILNRSVAATTSRTQSFSASDGNPETVEIWLAFIRKHAYYGIGMKANVFEFEALNVGKNMDIEMEKMKDTVDKTWDQVGVAKGNKLTADQIMELVNRENFRAATHGSGQVEEVEKGEFSYAFGGGTGSGEVCAVFTECEGVRNEYERILDDEGYVENVEREGGRKARESAEETMGLVRDAVGF